MQRPGSRPRSLREIDQVTGGHGSGGRRCRGRGTGQSQWRRIRRSVACWLRVGRCVKRGPEGARALAALACDSTATSSVCGPMGPRRRGIPRRREGVHALERHHVVWLPHERLRRRRPRRRRGKRTGTGGPGSRRWGGRLQWRRARGRGRSHHHHLIKGGGGGEWRWWCAGGGQRGGGGGLGVPEAAGAACARAGRRRGHRRLGRPFKVAKQVDGRHPRLRLQLRLEQRLRLRPWG